MKYFKRLFGRKCELLRESERELLWLSFSDYLARLALARVVRRNRKTAKELERRGVL